MTWKFRGFVIVIVIVIVIWRNEYEYEYEYEYDYDFAADPRSGLRGKSRSASTPYQAICIRTRARFLYIAHAPVAQNRMTFDASDYLDLNHTEHRMLFENSANVWDALKQITSYLQFRLKPAIHGRLIGKPFISGAVFVGKGTVIEQGAMIKGPAWIGDGCEIRNGCYIRENVIVGTGCVLGNACEFKNSIIFDDAQVPHFNYVGDSIVGYRAHLGAGVILSNVKLDRGEITISHGGALVPTGLKKFGAIIGDQVEIGCNAVINPGSLIGRRSIVYPGAVWRGVVPADSVVKVRQEHQILARRD